MIEVVGWITVESEFLHHATRSLIADGRETHDLVARWTKSVTRPLERGEGPFGREPATPLIEGQSPTDLDARCEVGRPRR